MRCDLRYYQLRAETSLSHPMWVTQPSRICVLYCDFMRVRFVHMVCWTRRARNPGERTYLLQHHSLARRREFKKLQHYSIIRRRDSRDSSSTTHLPEGGVLKSWEVASTRFFFVHNKLFGFNIFDFLWCWHLGWLSFTVHPLLSRDGGGNSRLKSHMGCPQSVVSYVGRMALLHRLSSSLRPQSVAS